MNKEFFIKNEGDSGILNNTEKIESVNEEVLAREIIQNNDFQRSSKELEQEGILAGQVTRVMELYQDSLEGSEFLTGRDWELLTMIELYSPDLSVHSIETYLLVRSKIENIYIGSDTVAQVIEKERVSLDEFYRSCLFHDVGKLHIPESILDNTFTKDDWVDYIYKDLNNNPGGAVLERLGLSGDEKMDDINIADILDENNLSPRSILPIRSVLTDEQIESLEERGVSADLTFKEVCDSHEISSQETLESEGLHTEALIAGQHHNYQRRPYVFPISSKTVGVGADLSELLHLADVEQALTSKRSYKSSFSHLDVLHLLIENIEKESVDKSMAALWLKADIPNLVIDGDNQSHVNKLNGIKLFIAENL